MQVRHFPPVIQFEGLFDAEIATIFTIVRVELESDAVVVACTLLSHAIIFSSRFRYVLYFLGEMFYVGLFCLLFLQLQVPGVACYIDFFCPTRVFRQDPAELLSWAKLELNPIRRTRSLLLHARKIKAAGSVEPLRFDSIPVLGLSLLH